MNTENNILIAEFMGQSEFCTEAEFLGCEITNPNAVILESLKYHSDWNWLMEVVEKIFKDFYKLNPCPIGLKITIEKQLVLVDKEAVYNACIAFIEWYNNQNK